MGHVLHKSGKCFTTPLGETISFQCRSLITGFGCSVLDYWGSSLDRGNLLPPRHLPQAFAIYGGFFSQGKSAAQWSWLITFIESRMPGTLPPLPHTPILVLLKYIIKTDLCLKILTDRRHSGIAWQLQSTRAVPWRGRNAQEHVTHAFIVCGVSADSRRKKVSASFTVLVSSIWHI
jgi:hypothetical protein